MNTSSPSAYFKRLLNLVNNMIITDYAGDTQTVDDGFQQVCEMIWAVHSLEKKIIIIGNGGSAAIASHMQVDLCNTSGFHALVFDQPPMVTALSNDNGYGFIYEKPVRLWAKPGDCLIAISSSGQSENIIKAAYAAKELQCKIVTLSGFNSTNSLRQLGHINFYISYNHYGMVELSHSIITHFITDFILDIYTKTKNKFRSKIELPKFHFIESE